MSYDEHDAAMDDMYERLSQELYPDHKDRAIEEFTAERLRSFYVKHPKVMVPAVLAWQEGKTLRKLEKHYAALIFFVTSIEVFLKATLLKPVVYGLVHNENLADILVELSLGQSGFDRYQGLLKDLFMSLAGIDIGTIQRKGAKVNLITECKRIQKARNDIIHKGDLCVASDAEQAQYICEAIYSEIVCTMLATLGLDVLSKGEIQPQVTKGESDTPRS